MEHNATTDSTLVAEAQAGDDAAFSEIMRRWQRPVLNFVYRLLGNAADAEDVAQEVFARLYQHLADYRPSQKFSTWLFALARHAAIDRLRWRQRHPTESLDTVAALGERGPSPSESAAHTELGDQIAAAIAALPEEQRSAIVLSEYHGLPDAEIAAIMNCSRKSVELRLYRAKQTLRAALRGWLDESR
jgi:RNA polymerase sigma-70 factor (ECF subfamily)